MLELCSQSEIKKTGFVQTVGDPCLYKAVSEDDLLLVFMFHVAITITWLPVVKN